MMGQKALRVSATMHFAAGGKFFVLLEGDEPERSRLQSKLKLINYLLLSIFFNSVCHRGQSGLQMGLMLTFHVRNQ